MKFEEIYDETLDESIASTISKIAFVASILLTSFGIQKGNDSMKVAQEFLTSHPTYIQKLEDLGDVSEFSKSMRNKIITQWKKFITDEDLDPKLASSLKTAGEGYLANALVRR